MYLAYSYTEDVHPTSSDCFIAGILEHRGYPLSIINSLLILQSALPNSVDVNTEQKNVKLNERRHEARVEQAIKLSIPFAFSLPIFRTRAMLGKF